MDELVGNTDGFADSGCVKSLDPHALLTQNNILLQRQFGHRTAISKPYIRCCTVPISPNTSNGNRCTELYNQTGLGSSTSG
jgi:hypothetical protein